MPNKPWKMRSILAAAALLLLAACQPFGGGNGGGNGGGGDDGNGGGTNPPPYNPVVCEHTGSGQDYAVGPGQPYTSLHDVPWDALGPGDTVRIFYRDEPYREKIVIRTDGSEAEPLRVCGVPGPNGERPILDGDGAVNDPDDAGAYGSYAPMEGLAMVLIWNRDYDLKVHHVVIEGLHIRNAKNTFTYTRMDGSTDNYEDGAACIRIQAADDVVIRGNELENCGNGIFTMSQGYNEAHLTRNLLIEGNYLHGHGQAGSYLEHGVYIQAIGVVYQYNRFGPNDPGSDGVTLKERVAGSVIRYNWFDSGSARTLDLVEVEDAAPWYLVSEYLRELGCDSVDNCPGLDPDRLAKVQEAEAAYRKSYVYGNFFRHVGSTTKSGNLVHYGSDNDPALSHNGTLYFYGNTVLVLQDRDDAWRFRLFYLGNRDAPSRSLETVEMFNNIVYFTGESGEASYFCLDDNNQGTIHFGVNWLSDDWQMDGAASECYYAGAAGAPTVTGVENLLDVAGAPVPLDPATLEPVDTPLVRDQAQPLPEGLPPIDYQYRRHLQAEPRPDASDLGARDLP
ncbi:hypothetical protein Ocepr_0195 [Oceanithermus profundus DSM 14977]|uniref:Uncharacterized protein n=1 Tax=Oceanithermus profundus (strain DSM 14977 / NBRC 100410 / VKM B-2274 / 506) TaxID=670487 RepID=E4U6H2_OCEP5|nr:right-handed parallel beta-helix repeat-containing protein [Oceanithermus profundus]ADR35658.1 hypothetical protein Ocepr_0195 [Oceanithermus profundus DSM 14977]